MDQEMRLESAITCLESRRTRSELLNKLSLSQLAELNKLSKISYYVERETGFEPATTCLEGRDSAN